MKNTRMHHFISIKNAPEAEQLYKYNGCYSIYIDDNDYLTKPFKVISTISGKTTYALTALVQYKYHSARSQDELALQIKHMYCMYDHEINNVKWHYWNRQHKFGMIDNENAHRFYTYLGHIDGNFFNALQEFIFNPKYIIILDDSRGTFETMQTLQMINIDNITKMDLENEHD